MAFKIIWSPEALSDLTDLTEYIAQDNPDAAERIGLAILEKAELLSQHPLLGRRIPESRGSKFREIIYPPYRIVYQTSEKTKSLEIIRIWHGARGEIEFPKGTS